MTEVTLVCWEREVIQETLDLKEWPECLVSRGQKDLEVHLGWMVSKACLGSKEDLGLRETKERLDSSELQDRRVWLASQV